MFQLRHAEIGLPVIQMLLSRQISLHTALVEGVLRPGRILEAAIARICRPIGPAHQDLRAVSCHPAGSFRCNGGIFHGRAQHHGYCADHLLRVGTGQERVHVLECRSRLVCVVFLRARHAPLPLGLPSHSHQTWRLDLLLGLFRIRKKVTSKFQIKFVP